MSKKAENYFKINAQEFRFVQSQNRSGCNRHLRSPSPTAA